jgi:hypothetical protein
MRASVNVTNSLPLAPTSLYAQLISNPHDDSFSKFYHRLEQGGYLTRRPVKSDSLLDRGSEIVGGIFTPTVHHLGKTEWTFSLATAIERQNPLCLLNPFVLTVSW